MIKTKNDESKLEQNVDDGIAVLGFEEVYNCQSKDKGLTGPQNGAVQGLIKEAAFHIVGLNNLKLPIPKQRCGRNPQRQ